MNDPCRCGHGSDVHAGEPSRSNPAPCLVCGCRCFDLEPRSYVRARLGAGLQANGRPRGHGGGCRCAECRAVDGP